MIKYKLVCKNCDLSFDSWFASSKEYEKLKKRQLLNCHKCNSKKIEKSLMAPKLMNRFQLKNDVQKNLRFKKINNQVNNPAQYSEIKKSIARLYTTIKNSK